MAGICVNAQDKPFEGVTATNLENIRYPFPVHFIPLDIQGVRLEMEYMECVGSGSFYAALAKNKAPEAIKGMLGNYPVLGRETTKKISHSELVELDDVGHLPHIEAYDHFIKPLIDFLKKEEVHLYLHTNEINYEKRNHIHPPKRFCRLGRCAYCDMFKSGS